MRDTPTQQGLLLNLAQLRSNAILAVDTSGGSAVSMTDVRQLEAIAAGLFGLSLEGIECLPHGPAPEPNGAMMAMLSERLPDTEAVAAHEFLRELQGRVHSWLTT